MMLFPLYCFRKFQDIEGQTAGPYFIVKGFGANHLLFREELVFAGITDTGINRPLFRTHLRDDSLNKRHALINAVRLVAMAGSTAPTARSGRCNVL